MRVSALAVLFLVACAADPVLLPDSGPCSSACGAGTVCQGGACAAVDAGGVDAGSDRPEITDAQPTDQDWSRADTGRDSGVTDAGATDVGSDAGADSGSDVPADVDPRQTAVCRGVNATCDGRRVNVQTGERDGGEGQTFFCGSCTTVCPAGTVCNACVCER